jgi:hypothetical protein
MSSRVQRLGPISYGSAKILSTASSERPGASSLCRHHPETFILDVIAAFSVGAKSDRRLDPDYEPEVIEVQSPAFAPTLECVA